MDEVQKRLLPRPRRLLLAPPKGLARASGREETAERFLPSPPRRSLGIQRGYLSIATWMKFKNGCFRDRAAFASTTKGGTPCFRPRGDGRAVPPESFATFAWHPKKVPFDCDMDEVQKRLLPRPRRLLLAPLKGVPRASGREETVERFLPSPPRRSIGIQRGYPSIATWMKFKNGCFRDPRRLLLAPPKGLARASGREETVERFLPSHSRRSLGIQSGYPSIATWMKLKNGCFRDPRRLLLAPPKGLARASGHG